MVLFTLTGLNVDVGLYEFIEYPTYDFPDISASYYLDLDLNPAEFDNIFYFKTTSPDMVDFVGFEKTHTNLTFNSDTDNQKILISDTLTLDWNYDIVIKCIWKPDDYLSTDRLFSLGNQNAIVLEVAFTQNYWWVGVKLPSKSDSANIRHVGIDNGFYSIKVSDTTADEHNVAGDNYYFIFKYNSFTKEITFANANSTTWGDIAGTEDEKWNYVLSNKIIKSDPIIDDILITKINYVYDDGPNIGRARFGNWNQSDARQYRGDLIYFNISNTFINFDGDMNFKCESSYWPDISFSQGVISNDSRSDIDNYLPPPSANGVHLNKNIGVQWLAKNITGGYNNSDLFANEEALVQQYIDLDVSSPPVILPMKTSYQYFRIIITNIDANPSSNMTNVGIASLVIYNSANSVEDMSDLLASTHAQEGNFYWKPEQILNIWSASLPQNGYGQSWSSLLGGYHLQTGNYIRDPQEITSTSSGDIAGEWIQWKHNSQISISKMLIQAGGYALYGLPPSRFILAGRNDPTETWNSIGTLNYIFEPPVGNTNPNYQYTIGFKDSIKSLITNTLDVSGGSDTEPLSNVDIGRNNVSREALLHLLDNDISANVQRVHNMISKSRTNVDSDGNDISFGDTSNLWIPIEFYHGDTIKFKLIYKPDQITNSSGAAVDDSGNALGTNTIEDQDYVVRLNIVGKRLDFYHTLSFLSYDISINNFNDSNILIPNIHTASTNIDVSNINMKLYNQDGAVYHDDPYFNTYVQIGYNTSHKDYIEANLGYLGQTNSTIEETSFMISFIVRNIWDADGGDTYIFALNNGNSMPTIRFSIETVNNYYNYRVIGLAGTDLNSQNSDASIMSKSTHTIDTSNNWRVLSFGIKISSTHVDMTIYENGILLYTASALGTMDTLFDAYGVFLGDYMVRFGRKNNTDNSNTNHNQIFDLARIDILEGVHNYGSQYMEYIREKYPLVDFS